jgi:RND family efflux transporter MFP subunit
MPLRKKRKKMPMTQDNEDKKNAKPVRGRRLWVWVALAAGILVLVVAWVIHSRLRDRAELAKSSKEAGRIPVSVVLATRSPANAELVLPANVQAFMEAPIYARTDGYLKRWLVDIGGKVRKGDLLAVIETPEVDQQLKQSEAALAQAEANLELARITAERWRNLLRYDGVTRQEVDQNVGAYKARLADFRAAQADVQRLKDLKSFERVVAPFTGIITARNTDVGALISAGTTQELFRLAQTAVLRVYASVPEIYSRSMRPGMRADLTVDEYPNLTFPGRVVRSAGAIVPNSRTLLTEVWIPNRKGELLPGSFGEVKFHIVLPQAPLVVPSNTLLFRSKGTQVALVTRNQTVHLQNIALGRDFGTSAEVVSGLTPQDSIILNPSDSISEGTQVTIVVPKAAPQGAGQQGAAPNAAAPPK